MNQVGDWIEANPLLFGLCFGGAVLTFLVVTLGTMMTRAGVSLRPLVFFVVFLGIVAGPQVAYHVYNHVTAAPPASDPASPLPHTAIQPAAVNEESVAASNGEFVHPERVFGADVDPSLILDAKQTFGDALATAEIARIALFPNGESVLAARFPSGDAAARAVQQYVEFLHITDQSGSDELGWYAYRESNRDFAHWLVAGSMFWVWTAGSEAALQARQTASIAAVSLPTIAAGTAQHTPQPVQPVEAEGLSPALMAVFVVLNLTIAVVWFFRGATWATCTPPPANASVVGVDALRAHLLALAVPDSPLIVAQSDDGERVDVTWQYGDAKWIDLARARGLNRAHKLSLSFDEPRRTVCVTEYWSRFDWSVGKGGADFSWTAARGIQFFQFEHERVIGAQLGPDGKPTGKLGYAYTFDLQAMKRPFIEAVTRSGWTWQPVFFDPPAWLRWLTG